MENWTPSTTNPGYIEKTITRGGATVVILRPVIDAEETLRRAGKVRTALEGAMRDYLHKKGAATK